MAEKDFIIKWVDELSNSIKSFPQDFLLDLSNCRKFSLPKKTLLLGNEFFGAYEILNVDGSLFSQAESFDLAKYIIYGNRNKPENILIPIDTEEIKKATALYEKYLEELIKKIESDYKKSFSGDKNYLSAVNEIFRRVNLTRH